MLPYFEKQVLPNFSFLSQFFGFNGAMWNMKGLIWIHSFKKELFTSSAIINKPPFYYIDAIAIPLSILQPNIQGSSITDNSLRLSGSSQQLCSWVEKWSTGLNWSNLGTVSFWKTLGTELFLWHFGTIHLSAGILGAGVVSGLGCHGETIPFSVPIPCPAQNSALTLVLLWGCCCTPALCLPAVWQLLAELIAPSLVFEVRSLLLGAPCPLCSVVLHKA